MDLLPLLEAEAGHHELPFSPVMFGVVAFLILLVMLAITLAIGKGRPHS
jgi:hypothetical protein